MLIAVVARSGSSRAVQAETEEEAEEGSQMSVSEGWAGSPWRDTVERALYTAVEAFLAVIVVTDLSTVETAVSAALAALISAAKTVVVQRRQAIG